MASIWIEPNIFKTAQVSASGNTAVWTPASGLRFRLTKYRIILTGNATIGVAGVLTVTFQDATTAIPGIAHDVSLNTTALGAVAVLYDSGWVELSKLGIVSAAINNALNVNLSAALTAGNFRVMVAGTEVLTN